MALHSGGLDIQGHSPHGSLCPAHPSLLWDGQGCGHTCPTMGSHGVHARAWSPLAVTVTVQRDSRVTAATLGEPALPTVTPAPAVIRLVVSEGFAMCWISVTVPRLDNLSSCQAGWALGPSEATCVVFHEQAHFTEAPPCRSGVGATTSKVGGSCPQSAPEEMSLPVASEPGPTMIALLSQTEEVKLRGCSGWLKLSARKCRLRDAAPAGGGQSASLVF